MNTYRRTAIVVGVLFLLGFAGVFGPVIVKPILESENYLASISVHKDLVVVGADALGPRRLMSSAGTAALAAEARPLGVPFYVLASVDKVLPAPLFERAVVAGRLDGRYEATDLALVTAVVTELGVLDPREAAGLAEDREVSPALLEGA